jgi:hypothetical protein
MKPLSDQSESAITPAMVERAARALCDEGIRTLNGKIATWEHYRDGFTGMAERVLQAAFDEQEGRP